MDNEMKLGGTVLAVPLTRTIEYLGLGLGPPILGNYRSGLKDLEFRVWSRGHAKVLCLWSLSCHSSKTQRKECIKSVPTWRAWAYLWWATAALSQPT